ncbi:MAG: 50S ribosomal protein L15 [SAR202 cluster bacterium]|jgi:large subunit ribosomal protein L15|nr:50S ribosomal protein L15 [Dehalococcoidia bacterium]MQG17652.1 50S ribosomal protein L15 [SAR202 cluster bacterium]MQG35506.1 50S ribosomal protein L15 [SAR202 cluster bacterium]MQG86130.1 50S ribosomal protein L15 [SAR202 cluster bacterium]CAI8290007.1 MAG: 50S ribosomal protein L15 [Chloroflexota bacterium]|tara:strand:- start:830 stop:1273 length:444 start_codon:yes stop_codon:yes gene_type:complete
MLEHDLQQAEKARKNRKRVGRGDSSGNGSFSGRGMKGQKSRSGKPLRPGFEGGQLPLIKGLPMKRGFNNIFKTQYSIVNVSDLQIFPEGTEISNKTLFEHGLISTLRHPVKVLGNGELSNKITIEATKFTKTALEKLEKSGSTAKEI